MRRRKKRARRAPPRDQCPCYRPSAQIRDQEHQSSALAASWLAISRSRYHLAFLRSSQSVAGVFFPARETYFTALPRLKPRPQASITLIASYVLSAPP